MEFFVSDQTRKKKTVKKKNVCPLDKKKSLIQRNIFLFKTYIVDGIMGCRCKKKCIKEPINTKIYLRRFSIIDFFL